MSRSQLVRVLVAAILAAACGADLSGPGGGSVVTYVDCTRNVRSVVLSPSADSIEIGRGKWLRAVLDGGSPPPGQICTYYAHWSSSDTNVVRVGDGDSHSGLLVARSPGTAQVEYVLGSARGTATITVIPVRNSFVSVSAGLEAFALASDGQVYHVVRGLYLGAVPVPLEGSPRSISLSAGGTGVCGSASDHTWWCGDQNGACGVVGTASEHSLTLLDTHGDRHRCALNNLGAALCWGENPMGQLGNGSVDISPSNVSGGLTFRTLAVGGNHSCGLTADGSTWCWGDNSRGQLGTDSATGSCAGGTSCQLSPKRVASGHAFVALAAGGSHACGLTADGSAWCWGWNAFGQLGTGDFVGGTTPRLVAGDITFAALSAGDRHTCGITSAGALYCWGSGAYGQLGKDVPDAACMPPSPIDAGNWMGDTGCRATPGLVPVAGAFTSVSAGQRQTCGMAGDGAWCWGYLWGPPFSGKGTAVHLSGQP